MTERKTIWKWFWVWEFEKEERWLNEMAAAGWVLAAVGWCRYVFERCEPGEYVVRLEMRGSEPLYMDLMADTGAEYIGRVIQWIYFRRKSEYGPFDLFSDIDSRVQHLGKIARALKIVGLANLLIGALNAVNGAPIGVVNLVLATLLMYGLGRIQGKQEQLEQERVLHE